VNEKPQLDAAIRTTPPGPPPNDEGPWPDGRPLVEGMTAPEPERPFQSVGFTISTTGYALARRFRDLLAPLALEPREFALLRTVAGSEGVTQQAIAEQMGVAPSRMVAFVDSLEDRGLLERRQNPNDRRARALYLTGAGRELLGRAFAAAVEHEQRLTSDLSPGERRQLLELLARVGAHVGIPAGVHAAMGHSALADELK
jgi:DNA-binding MarR family transcriptional regulator